MTRLAFPSLFAALLLLTACGGNEELPPLRRHLRMRPPESEKALLGTTVWKRLDVLREQPDWQHIAGRSDVQGRTDDGVVHSVLWLADPVGEPPILEVQIPGEFDPGEFNEFLVTVLAPAGEFQLVCSLWREGELVLSSAPVGLERKRTPQTLSLPVPRTQQHSEPFDRLAVTFGGRGERVGLISVHLRQRSLRTFLPSPTSAPRLIRIEDEWRGAVGLSSKRPLEGHVVVPPDAHLELRFARPPELDLADRQDALRVSITGDEGPEAALRIFLGPESEVKIDRSRLFWPRRRRKAPAQGARRRSPKPVRQKDKPKLPLGAFEEEVEEPEEEAVAEAEPLRLESVWTDVSLPLDDFAGQEVTVRVELVDWPEVETVCAVTPPVVVRPTRQPATVLLITASSLRADHLGAAGSGVDIDTALLDMLARRGVLFEDCLAPSNDTGTSLAALMTGTWPPTGAPGQAPASLAKRFRQAGFATWAVLGSAQLNPDFSGVAREFGRVLAPTLGERNAGATIDQLIGRIHEVSGVPLFIWLHLNDPEGPYAPPGNFLHEYYPATADPYSKELPRLAPHERPEWAPRLRDPAWPPALYRSEITYLDRRLRDIFEHPRVRRGAIIAFTADHGENLTGPGDWFSHSALYPETLAVPLLLAFPGAPAEKRISRPVSTTDLGRTLLDLAGQKDSVFPGQHLLRRRDRDAAAPRFAFSTEARSGAITTRAPEASDAEKRVDFNANELRFSASPEDHTAAVASERWFLVLQLEDPTAPTKHEQSGSPTGEGTAPVHSIHGTRLFNLASDPTCEIDVLDQYPGPGRALRSLLIQWLRAPAPGALNLPPPPREDCTCTDCSSIR